VYIKNNLKYGITNDARYTSEIKSSITMEKVAFNKKTLYTSKLNSNLRKKPEKCFICSILLVGSGKWTFRKVDQN